MRRPSLVAVLALVVVALLYAPIVLVVINSFNADELLVQWGGFTLTWYDEALSDQRVRSALVTSVQVAILSTVVAMALAITAALWARRLFGRRRQAFDATTFVRIILPETVFALGLFILFAQLDIPLGIPAVVVGHVVFLSAYATIILQARFATMNENLEAAAADLGAPPWRVFRRVTMPQILPAVIAGGLLIFSFSFDDVVTSLFLGGTRAETLPVLLLGLIRLRVTPEVNAIGVMVMLTTTILFAIAAGILSVRSAVGARSTEARGGTR